MINRRTFLKTSAAFGASCRRVSRETCSAAADTVITILHTNDTHSQIDPLPANDRNAGKGGVARRATLVKRIRKENPNTLLVDAGDVLQGTPYFNFYKGEVEYKAMSAIGYDAGTLGNHEFDNGVEALAAALKFANFDIVSANYDVKGTVLEGTRQTLRRQNSRRNSSRAIRSRNQSGCTDHSCELQRRDFHRSCDSRLVTLLRNCVRKSAARWSFACRTLDITRITNEGTRWLRRRWTASTSSPAVTRTSSWRSPSTQTQPCGAKTLIFEVGKSGIYVGRVDFTFRSGKLVAASGRLLDLRNV